MLCLLLDSNQHEAAILVDFLEAKGHQVDYAARASLGAQLVEAHRFQVLVIASDIAGSSAFEFCRRVRSGRSVAIPILMLGRGAASWEAAFSSGVDDFVASTAAPEEINARILSLTRRPRWRERCNHGAVLNVSDLMYDLDTARVSRGGKVLQLTPTHMRILRSLMESAPRWVSTRELEALLWGRDSGPSSSLRSHIYTLRRAVDALGVPLIQSRRDQGYCIAAQPGAVR